MTWQEFTALLALATAMSFSPGPNTTLSTALAANHGLRRALPFICSVPLGWGVLLGVCALGLGTLLLAVPWLAWAVHVAGVGYLLWLATILAGLQRTGVKFHFRAHLPETERPGAARRPLVTFWQGAALQFVNIKAWMLALAIVSGWIAGHSQPGLRFGLVLPVMLVFAFVSNLAYALVGSLLRDWLAGPAGSGRRLLWFNRAMAAVLVATAVWMLF